MLGIQVYQTSDDDVRVRVTRHVAELHLDDWVLDGSFQDRKPNVPSEENRYFDPLLVTAHNELIKLSINTNTLAKSDAAKVSCVASGPRSILYSAHLKWPLDNHALVAGGTVFGEVLLWSFDVGVRHAGSVGKLHRKFEGHEGSVFGVRISEPYIENRSERRILASCSDDRTIRVWDISEIDSLSKAGDEFGMVKKVEETGFPAEATLTASTQCLALVMGHTSRIWGLRFLSQLDNSLKIISHGEDSTAQVWRLSFNARLAETTRAKSGDSLDLKHQITFSYHAGKNIWAIAECSTSSGDMILATGGADGQIAMYKPLLHDTDPRKDCWSSQHTIADISSRAGVTAERVTSRAALQHSTVTRRIFDGLQGQWRLSRGIESANSDYPSGNFEGSATFETRLPSDKAFSAEYLYNENGDFVTMDGMTMRATRKYVYRYSRHQDKITVWFVKPEDGSTVDYLFHDMNFQGFLEERRKWTTGDTAIKLSAKGEHPCGQDYYTVEYWIPYNGAIQEEWDVTITVLGPKKDYITTATYTREREQTTLKIPVTTDATTTRTDAVEAPADVKPLRLKPDSFKIYAWLNRDAFLTSTEQGNLLVGNFNTRRKPEEVDTVIWEHVGQHDLLKSSCIATTISSQGICFLTGMDGTVFLYEHSSKNIRVVYSLHRKAGYLNAQGLSTEWNETTVEVSERTLTGIFATRLGSSEATALVLCTDGESSVLSVQEECHFQLPTDFVVTSSCFFDTEKLIILGSRSGDVAIYGPLDGPLSAAGNTKPDCFHDVHGQDAITVIEVVPRLSSTALQPRILTAGRDGSFGIHQLFHRSSHGSKSRLSLQTIHIGAPPFGPNIEGICIDADKLYLWGFRSKEFVVWNETDKTEAMTVDCGGAHRNWAYHHQRGGRGGGNFVYTKASVCHIHSQTQASHQVAQHGGHGREIKALALSPYIGTDEHDLRLLATGAEDTAIRIFDARSSIEGSRCLSVITKHTTGLQKLEWSPDGRTLFSAAGCEEFFVWRMQPAPLVTIGIVCSARCPRVTEEADLRIMDFAVLPIQAEITERNSENEDKPDYLITMAYSDSSMRVFRYHTEAQSFVLLCCGTYTTYCLAQVTYSSSEDNICVCTASTDGHLAFWLLPFKADNDILPGDVPHLISTSPASSSLLHPTTIPCSQRIQVHQNSIKSMVTITFSESETSIMTGGDDGAIAFTRLHPPLEESPLHSTLLVPKAHASAVTAVTHLGELEVGVGHQLRHRFASVGNDQRLKTWVVSINLDITGPEGISVAKESNVSTSVADASSLDVEVDRDGQRRLYVAGIGMETWRVGDGVELLGAAM